MHNSVLLQTTPNGVQSVAVRLFALLVGVLCEQAVGVCAYFGVYQERRTDIFSLCAHLNDAFTFSDVLLSTFPLNQSICTRSGQLITQIGRTNNNHVESW